MSAPKNRPVSPSIYPPEKWKKLAEIAEPEKWLKMYEHYQELLDAADVAYWWHEQFNIANEERNMLKKELEELKKTQG